MTSTLVDTPHGPARAELHCSAEGRAALLLGHGAGGGIGAPDLVVATRAATAAACHVALVEQPYRVAGRRAPAPAGQLDTAWLAVAEDLGVRWFDGTCHCCSAAARPAPAWPAARRRTAWRWRSLPGVPRAPAGQAGEEPRGRAGGVDVPILIVQGETTRSA